MTGLVVLLSVTIAGIQSPSTRPALEADEVALALSAAPESLRAEAGVFVLGKDGYRRVRDSRNGLNCLVGHDRPGTQEPICWDREGSETILPLALDEGKWRASGATEQEVARLRAEGFANGTYRAPRRPGIAYMLSTENDVFNGERVIRYHPHVMSYAPYLTNADISADGKDPNAPWILNEGSPHAYIIVVTRHGRQEVAR